MHSSMSLKESSLFHNRTSSVLGNGPLYSKVEREVPREELVLYLSSISHRSTLPQAEFILLLLWNNKKSFMDVEEFSLL